jgi:hypothetical protein
VEGCFESFEAWRPRVDLHHRSMELCEPLDPWRFRHFGTLTGCCVWCFEIRKVGASKHCGPLILVGNKNFHPPFSGSRLSQLSSHVDL